MVVHNSTLSSDRNCNRLSDVKGFHSVKKEIDLIDALLIIIVFEETYFVLLTWQRVALMSKPKYNN
jgi:hypothetical protein